MTGWVAQLIVVSGALITQTQAAVSYVKTLPPAPDQTLISCHDAAWGSSHLAPVAGNQIHTKLAPFVEALITEAQSQAVPMAITVAYRSCEYQLQLRGANCGLGDYNLYQKPSNLCTPPTEPAGKSFHNDGLAIDFACSGYALFEYSPCYPWLQNNAFRYHLKNHALEPWHWSTTGK
jgi:LAS superfamily LD-carboxypeptidase LdcB